MGRPVLEVADIFRTHGPAWRKQQAGHLSLSQLKVMSAVEQCRTAALGGHALRCDACDHQEISYNSCRNRHCPTCQPYAQAKWIAGRLERVLPVHHFHLVFTLPAELRGLAYAHKRAVYDLLFAAASATLARMSADKLGGTPGVTLVLHTWTRALGYHPHLHAIVTGGALSTDGARWKPARQAWLFPVAELAARFRGAFLSALRASPLATDAVLDLVRRLYRRRWVVYAKRAFGGAEAVYRYLGRYTHRVGLSNQRLVSLRGGAVVFRTRGDARMRLPVAEFAARLLNHVLPRGFRKVRHYGLLAPTNVHTRLARAGQLLRKAPVLPAAPARRHVHGGRLLPSRPRKSRHRPRCSWPP